MLTQFNRRLRDSALVTTAIMAMVGCDVYAHDADNQKTASPIKHVIVILGENRTFDHLFATYEPGNGEHVDNLLSKGIINKDGTPGPNYAKAAQYSAVDTSTYQISPGSKQVYGTSSNPVQAPGTSYAPQPATCYSDVPVAAVNGPGCLTTLALAEQAADGRRPRPALQPSASDLPLLTTGATGLPEQLAGFAHRQLQRPAERSLSAGDAARRQPLRHLWRQPGASLLSDVAAARLRRRQGLQAQSERLPGRSLPLGRTDRLRRQQWHPAAEPASSPFSRRVTLPWASTMSPRAMRLI